MNKKSLPLVMGLLVLGLLAASAAFADQPRNNADMAARRWEHLQKKLNLTTDQASRLQPIFTGYTQECTAARKANREKFLALLTPEQRSQLEKARTEREAARKQQGSDRGPRAGKHRPALNLTDAQKAQMKQMREEARAQSKSSREQFLAKAGEILTQEQLTQLTKMLHRRHRGHGKHGGPRGQAPSDSSTPAPTK